MATEHLVEDAPGEEDVAARVVLSYVGCPFQASVVDGSLVRPIAGVRFRDTQTCQPKVHQLGLSFTGDHHIGHLQIAMRDPLLRGVG